MVLPGSGSGSGLYLNHHPLDLQGIRIYRYQDSDSGLDSGSGYQMVWDWGFYSLCRIRH